MTYRLPDQEALADRQRIQAAQEAERAAFAEALRRHDYTGRFRRWGASGRPGVKSLLVVSLLLLAVPLGCVGSIAVFNIFSPPDAGDGMTQLGNLVERIPIALVGTILGVYAATRAYRRMNRVH